MLLFQNVNFIHIPKVGGTSIRKAFRDVDRVNYIEEHLDVIQLKHVDLNHMTLAYIRENINPLFNKLVSSQNYCLVRDPRERLYSSFAQYLSMFTLSSIENLTSQEMITLFDKIKPELEKEFNDNRIQFSKEFIHFQPQVDFIYSENQKIVKNIYRIEDIQKLLDDICLEIGIERIVAGKENFTVQHKYNFIASWIKHNERLYKSSKILFPSFLKRFLKGILFKNNIEESRKMFLDNIGNEFISKYYQEDIKLYEEVLK